MIVPRADTVVLSVVVAAALSGQDHDGVADGPGVVLVDEKSRNTV